MDGDDRDKSRWRHVLIDCRPDLVSTRTEFVGTSASTKAACSSPTSTPSAPGRTMNRSTAWPTLLFGQGRRRAGGKSRRLSLGYANEFGWRDLSVDEAARLAKQSSAPRQA
jgi:hypothetical protein